jgi:DNA-directed RNA polymerase specialized sigma24 family protein
MATLSIPCTGVNWSEDFSPLVPQLYAYYRAAFRGRYDPEEITHRAVLLFLKEFRKKWTPGLTLSLSTCYAKLDALRGRDLINPSGHRAKNRIRTRTNRLTFHKLQERKNRQLERLYMKDVIEQLKPKYQAVIELYIARYTYPEIQTRLGVDGNVIKRAIHKVKAMLAG